MDLKAASDENNIADTLTRAGMALCFLATGALLVGSLAFNSFHVETGMNFSPATQLSTR
jgi:Na+/H+-dicarboxylate symporter